MVKVLVSAGGLTSQEFDLTDQPALGWGPKARLLALLEPRGPHPRRSYAMGPGWAARPISSGGLIARNFFRQVKACTPGIAQGKAFAGFLD